MEWGLRVPPDHARRAIAKLKRCGTIAPTQFTAVNVAVTLMKVLARPSSSVPSAWPRYLRMAVLALALADSSRVLWRHHVLPRTKFHLLERDETCAFSGCILASIPPCHSKT